ncbi:MAG TPA: 30S ribosomal protein S6 [Spirochaetota bacterium]|nr:30S ribosomal protein S6 [Spirochaetota bacterium]HPJ36541.1 30S ribosomal protein S6 [Spirochaetota bacterium]
MKNYELTVIVRNRDVESLKEKVKEILVKNGVNITKEDHWGLKKLAYEIDREREAYYMFMLIEAEPASIDKIRKEFGLNADILRDLFVVLSKKQSA